MTVPLSRRRRHVALTVALAVAFAGVTTVALWIALRPEPVYRPGEQVEGLTRGLARSLPENHPRVVFVDVTDSAGIAFRHFWGSRSTQLPEDMGSGAAWGDYDNDGWLDLFVVNLVGPLTLSPSEVASSPAHAALYHNNADGTFSEVSAQAGVRHRGWGMAAAWGDYNNDGWIDLFISNYGANVFYHNNGDGTFSERTAEAGLAGRDGFWAGVAWGDYNKDGHLDLYVTGYVKYEYLGDAVSLHYDVEEPASLNPSAFDPEVNLLFRNNGDGTFSEIAAPIGVADIFGRSLDAAWVDFDEDGWPDLYVANDVSDNALYRNSGDGTFTDIRHAALVADYRGAMGIAVGDWDGDTDMDMFITHWIAQENALYNNLRSERRATAADGPSQLQFIDQADRFGVGQIALDYIGWGTFFFDYNNDGLLDLFVVNGSTFQQKEATELLIPMVDQLFWNAGPQNGFYDVSAVSGEYFSREYVGRGAAYGDYDNDGDLDVFVVNHGDRAVLLRNDGGNRNRWLEVELEGRESNRQAIGARLSLYAGGRVQVRQVGAQSPYLSQNSPIEHFGLKDLSEADSLVVIWPSGARQVVKRVTTNRVLRLVEGESPR